MGVDSKESDALHCRLVLCLCDSVTYSNARSRFVQTVLPACRCLGAPPMKSDGRRFRLVLCLDAMHLCCFCSEWHSGAPQTTAAFPMNVLFDLKKGDRMMSPLMKNRSWEGGL